MIEGSHEMRLGLPKKYSEGWEGANKQIYIFNETFVKWRRLREERSLPSDDSMACYLPTLYVNLESLCLPNQWKNSAWPTKELHHKSLQITMLYLSRRGAIIMHENTI